MKRLDVYSYSLCLNLLLPCVCLAESNGIREFFESKIRPVLIERCYECHNSTRAEGGLELDHRTGLVEGGELGPAIIPKDVQNSLLLRSIRHEVDAPKMPEGGPTLDTTTIRNFEKWIADGAFDPRDKPPAPEEVSPEALRKLTMERRRSWWALQPVNQPQPPLNPTNHWSDHPVDRFLFEKFAAQNLTPASPADPRTLLRRLSFALTGLPPQVNELEAFEKDPSPEAFDRVVARLLDSPAFGERWARHWMDWIRYAESHGSEGDPAIPYAFEYRDYLIRAFNSDVPYNTLIREHLAGDLLEEPRINQLLKINESAIGIAHLRMVFHGFSPTDAMEEKIRFVDDQINAVTKAFQSFIVSCARCHDHKFDAITQADYYALFGVFGSCSPGIVDANLPEQQAKHQARLTTLKQEIRSAMAASWQEAVDKLASQLALLDSSLDKQLNASDKISSGLHLWHLLKQVPDRTANAQLPDTWHQAVKALSERVSAEKTWSKQEFTQRWNFAEPTVAGTWFPHGNGLLTPSQPASEFTVSLDGPRVIDRILPAGIYSHRLSTKHRGVLLSPKIHLDDQYDLWVLVAGEGNALLRYAAQDYPRNGTIFPVTRLNLRQWIWQKYDLGYWAGDSVHVELVTAPDSPILVEASDRSWFGIRDAVLVKKGTAGPPDPELAVQAEILKAIDTKKPVTVGDLSECFNLATSQAIRDWNAGKSTPQQALWLDALLQQNLLPDTADQHATIDALLNEYRQLEKEIPLPRRVPGVLETQAYDQPLLVRGDHRKPVAPVPRRFLEAIDPSAFETKWSGRRELAERIASPDNPLTRRVIVNRLWHHLFGRGIVGTPDDFGELGELPTHPELLDYLATRMAQQGWSIKEMIRFLVTSKTWQASSLASPAALAIDPDNRLLSHASVRRLEAEPIRDSLLQVSGLLNRQPFGPSTTGDQPRRSVYVRVQRNALNQMLRTLDFPEPLSAVGRRDVTNVPAQSLTFMNDGKIAEYARNWAQQILQDSSLTDDHQRITSMFAAALGRWATDDETKELLEYLAQWQTEAEALRQSADQWSQEIQHLQQALTAIEQPARESLRKSRTTAPESVRAPQPLLAWDFSLPNQEAKDLRGELQGDARIEHGALVLNGQQAHFRSLPLAVPIAAKTLEAWVQLDNLAQQGGGVITVQTLDGVTFDSVVFGEQRAGHWLAGSNNFKRTQPFAGPAETEAQQQPVHVAITYSADGRIQGYRNGMPYGKPYQSDSPVKFEANQTVVTLGVRHLPASGNRMLKGRIVRARFYDRDLTSEEVHDSYAGTGSEPTHEEVWAVLTKEAQTQIVDLRTKIALLQNRVEALGPVPRATDEISRWTDVARLIFNLKEFIYLR